MRQSLLTLFVLTILIFCSNKSIAQSVLPPVDSYLNVDSTGQAIIVVILPDTISVTDVDVAIGTNQDMDDIFSHNFIYDQTTGLPTGLSYSRNGNSISLGTGSIETTSSFYVKVRLRNNSTNWSNWYQYVSN